LGHVMKTKCFAKGAVPARGSPVCRVIKLQNFEPDIFYIIKLRLFEIVSGWVIKFLILNIK